MKKVQILLSTYNGEKYVEEQINSLLQQTYPNVEILIRDDGSRQIRHCKF
jgi:glycosyltransferase involved in cell wall biosynthesis